MENELCVKCNGRGFTKLFGGRILGNPDFQVKADYYKLIPCEFCGGSGYYSEPMLTFKGVFWLLLISAIAAYVIVKQF